MVSASGDYTFHFGDPDKLVEWESIEQVVGLYTCMSKVLYAHTLFIEAILPPDSFLSHLSLPTKSR